MLFDMMMLMKKVSGAVTYATWDPANKGANISLSGGNLIASSSAVGGVRSTIGKSSGKWYWEYTATTASNMINGVGNASASLASYPGSDANGWGYRSFNGDKANSSTAAYGASYVTGDVIGVALDITSGTIEFYKNNVSQGVAFSGLSGTIFAMCGSVSGSDVLTANFGATALTYTPPSGFNAGLYV